MADITNGMSGLEARELINGTINRKYNPISKTGIKMNIMSSSSGTRTAQSQTTSINVGGGVTRSADNLVLAVPFIPQANVRISQVGIECTVAGAGGAVKVYIYDDQSGQPNNQLFAADTFDCSTTGVKTQETDIIFNQGIVYWVVTKTQRPTTNFTIRAAAVATNYNLGINIGTNNYYTGYYENIADELPISSLYSSLLIGTILNTPEAQFTVLQ
jgi:hypothetical protein